MKARAIVMALMVGVTMAASADVVPKRGALDSRLRTVLYSEHEVVRLTGFVGYALDLEFAKDETFVGLSAGDPEALTYAAHDNVLTLRPRALSSDMNLSVSTSKHRYYFDYRIRAHASGNSTDEVIYAVRFSYPADISLKSGALEPARAIEQGFELAAKARPRNWDYWYCGDVSIRPLRAFDDGIHTHLVFAPRAELPAIFVKNDDESESLLNFNIEADEVVIHRIAPRFIVRRGRLTGCIVNRSFLGTGDRLDSGTVSTVVERQRKEASP